MKQSLLKGSRSRLLAAILLGIAGIFVLRLFYLQIIQHNYYVGLANTEQVKRERLPASRGEIYALSGSTPVKLVLNETVYTVFADPSVIKDTQKVVDVMKNVAGGNVVDSFGTLITNKQSRYAVIAKKVTRTQAEKIKAENLLGIGFQAVSQRVYPEGSLAAQTLGFVNADGVGNYGIEGYLNSELSGTDGRLETVTDVSDVPLTIGDRNISVPAKNGDNVVLSVDRNVQSKVEELAKSYSAKYDNAKVSVLVMNPNTGKVMAMANTPSYDPAKYNEVTDPSLFNNETISSPYEPGSDMKTYTMATAIDKGVAKGTDTFYNTDSIVVEDRTISNATKGITGNISFQTAMNWSLNTGFVTLGMRLGNGKEINSQARNTIYEYFHDRFRLGQLTGVELANESAGIVIPPTDTDGNAVRYSNMTFGQGLDATMIQVSAGFSSIINGGTYYKPTVISGKMVDGVYEPAAASQPLQSGVVQATTSQQIREMTHTARQFSFPGKDKAGYYVGGKTGTSQVIKNGQYSNDETIGTYLGYGGGSADSPEYVIMVSVSGDHKTFGGAANAMPVFTDVSNWLLDYLKIQPKG
jgi:stage V sporulation protein D (sporulation-specific penicillin-binding protein)